MDETARIHKITLKLGKLEKRSHLNEISYNAAN
jgi:hypothetical protein